MIPKVSVIVPVYKAEKYIHKCMQSLLSQTFSDFEIILVDDGSPDSSGVICDEYAFKDNRVKCIHKSNGGVSSARQCGLEYSSGEYTIHVDPDDWVESSMIEDLYRKAIETDADIVICDYYEDCFDKQRLVSQKPLSEKPKSILRAMLFQQLHGSCWNKLVRRVCYNKFNITFPKNFNLCEDLYVNSVLCSKIDKIVYLPKAFYHYDISTNVESYTKSSYAPRLKDLYYMILALDKELKDCRDIEDALIYRKLDVCFKLILSEVDIERHPIYESCSNIRKAIRNMPNIHFVFKLLLWFDYKGYNFLVYIILKFTKYYKKGFYPN